MIISVPEIKVIELKEQINFLLSVVLWEVVFHLVIAIRNDGDQCVQGNDICDKLQHHEEEPHRDPFTKVLVEGLFWDRVNIVFILFIFWETRTTKSVSKDDQSCFNQSQFRGGAQLH